MKAKEQQEAMDKKFLEGSIKNLYVSEIFEGVAELTNRNDRIAALKTNKPMMTFPILTTILDKNIEMMLSAAEAKEIVKQESLLIDASYMDPSMTDAGIENRLKIIQRFRKADLQSYHKDQAKKMLGDLVHLFSGQDVKILEAMFTKKMPYKGITASLVNAAFGDGSISVSPTKKEKK